MASKKLFLLIVVAVIVFDLLLLLSAFTGNVKESSTMKNTLSLNEIEVLIKSNSAEGHQ